MTKGQCLRRYVGGEAVTKVVGRPKKTISGRAGERSERVVEAGEGAKG